MKWAPALLVAAALTGRAAAATVTLEPLDDDDDPIAATDQPMWLNGARCDCGGDVKIRVKVTAAPASGHHLEIYSGRACLTADDQKSCALLANIADPDAADLATGRTITAAAAKVMWPPDGATCQVSEISRSLIAVDVAADGTGATSGTLTLTADGQPPAAPVIDSAVGGDRKVVVKVVAPKSTSSVAKYQVLCRKSGAKVPVFATAADPAFVTAGLLCPGDGPVGGDPDAGFDGLDRTFVCGGAVASSAGSVTVDLSDSDVDNGDAIDVRVLAIDAAGNASGSARVEGVLLVAAAGFDDAYRDAGGTAGDGCAVGGGRGGGGAVAVVPMLLVGLAGGLGRRRRAALLGLLLALPARAQSLGWSASAVVGPYTPGIDGSLAPGHTPYADIFGGAAPLFRVGLERVEHLAFGDVGLGVEAGYMGVSAAACTYGADGHVDCRHRSKADSTGLRVVPLSIEVAYHLTALSDGGVLPIVPYVRLGLDVFEWWETGAGTTRSGATLGWRSVFGLALRLDGLDPGGTAALRQEFGVAHVDLIGEVIFLETNGLGMDGKLPLGDHVWALGLGFEM